MTTPTTHRPKRRRRAPEVAVREILVAAEQLLAERPFRELSVDEVMARTTLSRSSFYVYFRDRYDLLLRLVGEIEDELQRMNKQWITASGDDDPRTSLAVALAGVVDTYETHGRVMRAIADAAVADPQVEMLYDAMLSRFIEVNAAHILEQQAAGLVTRNLDAAEIARALVWMTERFLVRTGASDADERGRAVAALASVWTRTLYGG